MHMCLRVCLRGCRAGSSVARLVHLCLCQACGTSRTSRSPISSPSTTCPVPDNCASSRQVVLQPTGSCRMPCRASCTFDTRGTDRIIILGFMRVFGRLLCVAGKQVSSTPVLLAVSRPREASQDRSSEVLTVKLEASTRNQSFVFTAPFSAPRRTNHITPPLRCSACFAFVSSISHFIANTTAATASQQPRSAGPGRTSHSLTHPRASKID